MQPGSPAWMLDQAKGYIVAFMVASVTVPPLVLLDVLDRQWLVLPGALAITSAIVAPLILGHRWAAARRARRERD